MYLLDLRSGALRPIAVSPDVGRVVWSHASDRLVVVGSPLNSADDLGPADTTWLVTVAAPSHATRLATVPPTVESVVWSADDSRLFFTAQAEADAPPGYADLYVIPLAGGAVRDLSKEFSGTIESAVMGDGGSVIAGLTNGTEAGFARIDPTTWPSTTA